MIKLHKLAFWRSLVKSYGALTKKMRYIILNKYLLLLTVMSVLNKLRFSKLS